MTKAELNRDIKRLAKNIVKRTATGGDGYYEYIDQNARREFTRLYYADKELESMSKLSVLLMYRINLTHRFVALHTFGIHMDIEKLLK